jgi:hypothetical protein
MAQYFYDNQIRRFLVQFARIFSNWYVTKGKDPAGNEILIRVPIQYGDQSRQASTVIANNSYLWFRVRSNKNTKSLFY